MTYRKTHVRRIHFYLNTVKHILFEIRVIRVYCIFRGRKTWAVIYYLY